MKKTLATTIAEHICRELGAAANPADVLALLEPPKNPKFGDLAFPCFSLAKEQKKSPIVCAEELAARLVGIPGIAQTKALGPFVNFKFDRGPFCARVLQQGIVKIAPSDVGREKRRAVVEYSSPNIAKPFHVGHLRATLIGNCLDRAYRFCGWDTVSINHLGDWGTQFGFVWVGCNLWGKPANNSVVELLEIYRRATGLKEEQERTGVIKEGDPDVNSMARQYFLDLEAGKDYALEFWRWCSEISLEYFKKTYARLGIRFDHYTGESFYSDQLEDVRRQLLAAGLLVESEGAWGVDLQELGFARVFSADGRSLYLTRDLAAAMYRAKTFAFDRAVYVVGAPQILHFQQLKGILAKLLVPYAERIVHVPFGHVLGIRTRGEGQFIELNEFLDDAYRQALKAYHTAVSKRPEGLDEREVARCVALSAIIYGNLARTNIKDVHFDWDKAFNFQGDSGPYLLYAYARLVGIREKAQAAGVHPAAQVEAQHLTEDSAFELCRAVDGFGEVVNDCLRDHEPMHLVNYCLELSRFIAKAYLELKVVGEEDKEVAAARLALFELSRETLGQGLELLGMEVLQRM